MLVTVNELNDIEFNIFLFFDTKATDEEKD